MKNHVFDFESYGPMQPKDRNIAWFERIALFFIKPQIAMDPGSGWGITFKRFRGKMFVIDEWRAK